MIDKKTYLEMKRYIKCLSRKNIVDICDEIELTQIERNLLLRFYDGDMDVIIENHKEKIVKCRKDHKCSACQNIIKKGDKALYESGFMDGAPVSSYTFLKCIEDWLEESGQVEEEDWHGVIREDSGKDRD